MNPSRNPSASGGGRGGPAALPLPPARPLDPPVLALVLRAKESGALLAREWLGRAELLEHLHEAWLEGWLRRGFPAVACADLEVQLRPVPLGSASLCAGFHLETARPNDRPVATPFTLLSLQGHAAALAERLLAEGRLAGGDSYTFELQHDPGGPTPAGPGIQAAASLDFEVRDCSPGLSWLEVPLQPLLEQATSQDPVDGAFPVFFTAAALARAEQFARRGGAALPPVETGAVLVGAPCSCPESGEFFVVVTDTYEVIGAEQKAYSLSYTDRSWRRIQQVVRARQVQSPAFRLLGQAHGHNFTPGEGRTCEECPTRAVCDVNNIYASADDHDFTRAVFAGAPFALCLIFGLTARRDPVHGLFTQRDGRLRRRGYGVLPDFQPHHWASRTAASPDPTPTP